MVYFKYRFDENLKSLNLSAWYITGLTDAEGSFQITIQDKKGQGLTGFKPFLEFKITQKKYSIDLLLKIKEFFNCGRINIDNSKTETLKFVVTNINDLMNKVLPHFDNFPLKSSKYLNYIDFKEAVFLMYNKEHFTSNGINKLKGVKTGMNKSRTFKDKFNFCWNSNLKLSSEWV